jgi:hypothetical protein
MSSTIKIGTIDSRINLSKDHKIHQYKDGHFEWKDGNSHFIVKKFGENCEFFRDGIKIEKDQAIVKLDK